ncbi:aminotransferase DegT/DnrJ/EryC1/StrS family [Butyrivibrio proteoclasticus B316]|uniref:Aminotransferase DegT/DnrJ/EryC1/StrS family n=1 Tax=Butyrivibrio proteoclasticus (strain ATCC 51982 / DSM 14932 / B316) TaxID=515622 RepID=E0RZD4_BUTPB|nr:DegT/DnrJ/EryC1/StrS family aminotransferase [Butyrivibrio proteoclasticus]ADL33131.1 aminotransferase DegT/DnrJ/EryC1/StrS family [Butyrivibrio proteoclasticus B316]
MTIEFRDLKRQYEVIKNEINTEISSVIEGCHFISGPQVKELERTLADYVGRKHCISCANGTDAISIALMAAGVGKGDAVFVPDFTFFSSGECPASVGATPIFVDVDLDTYNISASSLRKAIDTILEEGELKPKAVVAVDLFGQPFDYQAVKNICEEYKLILLEDAAQGFGGEYTMDNGEKIKAGKLGTISTTSFFPAKPLGCYGDGGAIFTDDDRLAELCRSIAVHGKDMEHPDDPNAKYNNIRLGMNSRLDTMQAAVLLAKFPTFCSNELDRVNHVAEKYHELLKDVMGLSVPHITDRYYSSWAQYTIQLPENIDRSVVQKELRSTGIPTNIYYIKPMHKQGAFEKTRSAEAECPNTEKLCSTVLCLPIHPYLHDDEVDYICKALKDVMDSLS